MPIEPLGALGGMDSFGTLTSESAAPLHVLPVLRTITGALQQSFFVYGAIRATLIIQPPHALCLPAQRTELHELSGQSRLDAPEAACGFAKVPVAARFYLAELPDVAATSPRRAA